MPSLDRDAREVTYFSIHCQGKRSELAALHTEVWATVPSKEAWLRMMASDSELQHLVDILDTR